jgi:hypothetical protein
LSALPKALPKGSLLHLYPNVRQMQVLRLRSSSEMMELLSLPALESLEVESFDDDKFDEWDWRLFPQPRKLRILKFPLGMNVSRNETFRHYLLQSTIQELTMNRDFLASLEPLPDQKVCTSSDCVDGEEDEQKVQDMITRNFLSSICIHRTVTARYPQIRQVQFCFLKGFESYTAQQFMYCFPNCTLLRLDYDSWGDEDVNAPGEFQRVRGAVLSLLRFNSRVYIQLARQLKPLISNIPLVLASRVSGKECYFDLPV